MEEAVRLRGDPGRLIAGPRLIRQSAAVSFWWFFFAAAIMDLAGPVLCRFALNRAGETAAEKEIPGGAL